MKFKLSDKRILIPFIIVLLGTILMAATVFMPYGTATNDFQKELDSLPNAIISNEITVSTHDLANRSMADYAKLYAAYSDQLFSSNEGYVYTGMVIAIAAFALLGTLFAILKKGTPIIVFTCLSVLVFAFQSFDFSYRGIIPSDVYVWGYGYYVFYIAAAVAIIGAVWLIISKHKIKKEANK